MQLPDVTDVSGFSEQKAERKVKRDLKNEITQFSVPY
jgi:hypothetical protein